MVAPMTRRVCAVIAALLSVAVGLAGAPAHVAEAQPAPSERSRPAGPPTPDTCYWTERAFQDLPELGPGRAKGVILWSHGQDASGRPNWQYGAPPVIRLFADTGWDVILVQRNERCQGRWVEKGGEYVSNLVSQVRLAKQNGYRRVLVAGHSVGAGTALGAAGVSSDIDGVLAFALSHGRSGCRDPRTFMPQMIAFHEREIRNGIEQNRAPRILICMGKDDHCVGHSFTPLVSSALAATGRAYIHFDETMAIAGHGAANTGKFARLYGKCIREFFDRTDSPAPGRHVCAESE